MTAVEPEGLVHTLVELTRHAERLAVLDAREAAHAGQIAQRLDQLDEALKAVTELLAEQRKALEGVDVQVTSLAAEFGDIVPDDGTAKVYRPGPAPQWWKLHGTARDEALARLRAWVEQIYRPMYGHLATLGPCWQNHPLCLFTLDWLSELWSVLYLQRSRNDRVLAGQAEFQTRLLPAAAEQLAAETARCEHAQPHNGQRLGAR
jgi:hypothetical protein